MVRGGGAGLDGRLIFRRASYDGFVMDDKAHIYQFDNVKVDAGNFRIWKAETTVQMEPKAFQVLIFLIENRGRLIEKRELLDAIWKETFVTENALTREIAQLRKALGESAREAKYIETVPTKGYRFIAEVEVKNGRPKSKEVKEEQAASVEEAAKTVESANGFPSSQAPAVNGEEAKPSRWLKQFSPLVLIGALVLVGAGGSFL